MGPGGAGPGAEEARDGEQVESLARVERGDIPMAAERRLGELRDSGGTYTSDLSIASFALCSQLGLRPLAQVMGSSVYQVGYQGLNYGLSWGSGMMPYSAGIVTELETLSEAWNEARGRALYRLSREAQEVGADAVVGVTVSAEARDFGDSSMSSGVIEYSVIGTAVRRDGARAPQAQRARPLVLTELSVGDYAKLIAAGIEPAGIAAWSSVFFAMYSYRTATQGGSLLGMGMESFELPEFSQAIYAAREQVMSRLGGQAQALAADGIVGVRISHQMHPQKIGSSSQEGLLVTFHAIGTAVAESAGAQVRAPQPIIDLTGGP